MELGTVKVEKSVIIIREAVKVEKKCNNYYTLALSITEGVAVHLCLTNCTLVQTGFSCSATLPEPAAV